MGNTIIYTGDRVAYELSDSEIVLGTVSDVRSPARIGEQTTILVAWDDGFREHPATSAWIWPNAELKLVRA